MGIEPPETATLNTPRASTDSFAMAPNRLTSSEARASGLDPTRKVVVMAGGREKTAGLRERSAVLRLVSCRPVGRLRSGLQVSTPFKCNEALLRQRQKTYQRLWFFELFCFFWHTAAWQKYVRHVCKGYTAKPDRQLMVDETV